MVSGRDDAAIAEIVERSVNRLALPREKLALGETICAERRTTWSRILGTGPLPTITMECSDGPDGDVELLLHGTLGEGGMGRVFLGTQRSLGREVAVKTVKDPTSVEARAALRDEAIVTGSLAHPNVVPVYLLARDAEHDRPLLVMKRVEGTSWQALLDEPSHPFWSRNKIPPAEQRLFHIETLRQVAHALSFAHSQGVVHRDVKPSNVLIGDFGETYLVDWGLAAPIGASSEEKLVGTPSYLAPEMIVGNVDERTDVYLLGGTLHEILTRSPPHRGSSIRAVLSSALVSEPPALGNAPAELATLCTRALSRHPEQRPRSAAEFGDALASWVRHRGALALSHVGTQHLAALRDAVESIAPADRDLAHIHQLVIECRFAFREATRVWPENPDLEARLCDCLEIAARVELDRGDPDAARAFLAQLPEPNTALLEEARALDEARATRRAEHERLQRLERELDPAVGEGARTAASIIAALVLAAVAAHKIALEATTGITMEELLLTRIPLALGTVLVLVVLGKGAFRTQFNRRFVGWAAIVIATEIVYRTIMAEFHAAEVHEVLATGLLMWSAFWVMGALFLYPAMSVIGVGLGFCGLLSFARPDEAVVLSSLSKVAAVLANIVVWRLASRRRG